MQTTVEDIELPLVKELAILNEVFVREDDTSRSTVSPNMYNTCSGFLMYVCIGIDPAGSAKSVVVLVEEANSTTVAKQNYDRISCIK